MIIQIDDAPPSICMGPIFAIYPPACEGPTLKGEFTWDGIGHTVEVTDGTSGRTTWWTETNHTVVGHFDPDDGEHGSFTLTRPVTLATTTPAASTPPEYPALCEDPLRGGDPAKADVDAMNLFTAELAKMPTIGYWVSNGLDFYNVLVPGDPQAVHAQLRTVWGGELCVETSDAPTEADRLEVLEAIRTQLPPNRYLSGSGGTPLDTVVELQVTVEDDAVKDVVESRARTDIEVSVTAVFTPVDELAGPPVESVVPTLGQERPLPTSSETADANQPQELIGFVSIYQSQYDDLPRLYLCGVPLLQARSRAPDLSGSECDGPTLKGDFDWGTTAAHPASPNFEGTRWTLDGHRVQGYLDPSDGEHGSFTLTQPVVHIGPDASQTPLGGARVTLSPDVEASADDALRAVETLKQALAPTDQFVRVTAGQEADGTWLVDVLVLEADDAVVTAIKEGLVLGVSVQTRAVFSPIRGDTASPNPESSPPDTAESPQPLTGRFAIYEDPDTGEPYLCDGNIGYSLPPVCGRGPTLKGEFSWDDIQPDGTAGRRWTIDQYIVHGHYDPTDGEHGSFTLIEPVEFTTEELDEIPRDAELAELCAAPDATSDTGVDGVRIQFAAGQDGSGEGSEQCASLLAPVSDAELQAVADEIADAVPASFPGILAISAAGSGSVVGPEVQVLLGAGSPEWMSAIRDAAAGRAVVVVRTLLTPVGDAKVTVVVP